MVCLKLFTNDSSENMNNRNVRQAFELYRNPMLYGVWTTFRFPYMRKYSTPLCAP